jgi:hypothetical protein
MSSCRETAKNAIKENRWEKTKGEKKISTFSAKKFFDMDFPQKVFDMDFPQKVFYGVFELPLLRNAQKRHKKISKKKKKKGTYLPHLVAICQIHAAFNSLFP